MSYTIDIDEAANILKCSPLRVREGLKLREIPGVKIGKVIMREAFFRSLNDLAMLNLVDTRPRPKLEVRAPRPNR
jgi:hypothetical protein